MHEIEIPTMTYERPSLPAPIALHLSNFQYRREVRPVWHNEKTGTWHVYRYSDVLRVLTDGKNFGEASFSGSYFSAFSDASRSPDMAVQRHALVYNLMREALSPGAVLQMQPYIERAVGGLLDPLLSTGKLEVIGDLAQPLANSVLAELVGVPIEDREGVELSQAYFASLVRAASSSHIASRRSVSDPGSDRNLISRLRFVEVEGERLTEDELAASCYFFMTTTRRAISDMLGNMLLLLSLQPGVLKRLRREPAPLYSTVEEVLRYLPPVWTAHRTVIAPVALGGLNIPEGANICAWLVSANHDPEQFADPDRFDIDRIPNRHLSFGDNGTFSCLGGGLTRLVARITLAAIARRVSGLELAPGDAVEFASSCEPGEPGVAIAVYQPGPMGRKPACGAAPNRCSLAKVAVVVENQP